MSKHRVEIDGVETVLTYDQESGNRGHQYVTPDNRASHAFQECLKKGQEFRVNGHLYKILS